MIKIEQLSLLRRQKKLLHNLSLSIPTGARFALLGANGAGKSTLLKCLAYQHTDYYGHIRFAQQNLRDWQAAKRAKQMAVMPQTVELSFPFNAQAVVAMGRAPFMDEAQSGSIIQQAMQACEVWHLRKRSYPTLSGGEQQRVQLARVLTQIWQPPLDMQQQPLPRYLLLDECTAALDPTHQHSIMRLADQFAAQGVTVIAVMHDVNLAASWADEVLLLKEGKRLAHGKTSLLTDYELLAEAYDLDEALAKQYAKTNRDWQNFYA